MFSGYGDCLVNGVTTGGDANTDNEYPLYGKVKIKWLNSAGGSIGGVPSSSAIVRADLEATYPPVLDFHGIVNSGLGVGSDISGSVTLTPLTGDTSLSDCFVDGSPGRDRQARRSNGNRESLDRTPVARSQPFGRLCALSGPLSSKRMGVHEVAAAGFNDPGDYEAARPSYPPEAVAWLVEHLRIGAGSRVCDLAAGTGKLTRLLAPTGAQLLAAEPVEGMRATFHELLPEIPVVAATAEALPFAPASLDAITVAQAWHWFDAERAAAECARVIKPGGALGLVWNARDRSEPWVNDVWSIMDRVEKHAPWRDHEKWSDSALGAMPEFGPVQPGGVPSPARNHTRGDGAAHGECEPCGRAPAGRAGESARRGSCDLGHASFSARARSAINPLSR